MATPKPTSLKRIISSYISSGQGRSIMAAKMTGSLRRFRDYTAVGRKAFLVDNLEDGALPIYDKDPIVPAYVVADTGDNIARQIGAARAFAPLFEIAANPLIPLTEVTERRYNLIKRTIELGVSGIKEAEDVRVFATINGLATDAANPHTDISVAAPLQAGAISDAFARIEAHGLRVARVFMNGIDYSDVRKFDRDVLDPETQQAVLRTGVVGKIYGAQVIRSRVVPAGTIYVCAEKEYYGRMPVRHELTILNADLPSERKIGFSMFEQLGILAYNFFASQRILVTR